MTYRIIKDSDASAGRHSIVFQSGEDVLRQYNALPESNAAE
jgi:hypothetical protein